MRQGGRVYVYDEDIPTYTDQGRKEPPARREVRVRRPSVVADDGTHPRTVAGLRRMEEHPLARMGVVVAKTR